MSGGNPWLQRQRKTDLIDLAERVGLDEYVHILPASAFFQSTLCALHAMFATSCRNHWHAASPAGKNARARAPSRVRGTKKLTIRAQK